MSSTRAAMCGPLHTGGTMRRDNVRLFKTVEHPCGYYAGRVAQNWVLDPVAPELGAVYGAALAQGFRRAGGHVYRPTCPKCSACTPSRVPVLAFAPGRRHRRCARANADLDVRIESAAFSDEAFALYRRYLQSRHPDGGMDRTDPEDFSRFLFAGWSRTQFLMLRERGTLVGCAVTDVVANGLSAVYTFYDPDQPRRGLGMFAILSQIQWALRAGLPHLYLGYWIDGHPKMHYKTDYRPIELLQDGKWFRV
jgi:arginyl-tRNA--protein-N-Asp/Glu arginylyltransferase